MIKIHDVVKSIVDKDVEIKNMMSRGFLNLSQYARHIQERVEEGSKKEVSVQSIVVSLSRLEKKIKAYDYMPEIKISQLSFKKPITEIVYENKEEVLSGLSRINKMTKKDDFLSFSTSSKDISIIFSSDLEDKLRSLLGSPRVKKTGLAAVSIRFDEELVSRPAVGFSLLQKIASKRIVLEEVVSTLNEFTLVFDSEKISLVMEALDV
jgi:hypothetical protein